MSTADQLMSRKDVAKRLSISVRTVDRHARNEAEFPTPIAIGRRVLYRSIEVDAYVKGRGLTARDARQRNARLHETHAPSNGFFAYVQRRQVLA
jgi:predicted DNA-binding transcriptional regulator AlpA